MISLALGSSAGPLHADDDLTDEKVLYNTGDGFPEWYEAGGLSRELLDQAIDAVLFGGDTGLPPLMNLIPGVGFLFADARALPQAPLILPFGGFFAVVRPPEGQDGVAGFRGRRDGSITGIVPLEDQFQGQQPILLGAGGFAFDS